MSSIINFKVSKGSTNKELLRIDVRKKNIGAQINAYKFIDNDTKQVVIYLPSLDISGYGETFEKATEMLRFSVKDFCGFITKLSPDEINSELSKLDWRKGTFNKQYSKAYINIDGQLKNFNAENNKIEQLTLTAA